MTPKSEHREGHALSQGVPRGKPYAARTVPPRKLSVAERSMGRFLDTEDDRWNLAQRPKTRGDCLESARPCPWSGCRWHMHTDVNPEVGSLQLNFPDHSPLDLAQTCALDIADLGGVTLEDCGQVMNITRERVRQIEADAMRKLRAARVSLEGLLS